jgi:hypothetical protein
VTAQFSDLHASAMLETVLAKLGRSVNEFVR